MSDNGITDLLEQIDIFVEDISVPRSIKVALADVKECFAGEDGCDLNLKKDNAQLMLTDIADDPNIPISGRTVVWDVLSRIESL